MPPPRLLMRPRSPLLTISQQYPYHTPQFRTIPRVPSRLLSTVTTTADTPDKPIPENPDVLRDYQKAQKRALKERGKPETLAADLAFSGAGPWEVTCGLEVHAQLHTYRKLFSAAKCTRAADPNSRVSVIDASLPGTQLKLNLSALLPALRAAIAFDCDIARVSRFDRKHYFYWDQPAGYQITQFYEPFAKNGKLTLTSEDDDVTEPLEIKIRQIQLEQDTGKTIAAPPNSLVDLNRVGVPLIEIITDPFPLQEAATAGKVLAKIQAVLRSIEACTLGMEWGGLRADVNVSVRARGAPELGQRCEIKNLSSFKAVTGAIAFEAERQILVLEGGGTVLGETRGWDAEYSVTRRLRGKEGEVDYRYMPDADLPAIVLGETLITSVRDALPMLPAEVIVDLTSKYGLPTRDARTLVLWDEGCTYRTDGVIGYFKSVVKRVGKEFPQLPTAAIGRIVGNWQVHELGGHLATFGISWKNNPVGKERLAELIMLKISGRITNSTAKIVLPRLLQDDSVFPSAIVHREGLGVKNMNNSQLEEIIRGVIEADDAQKVVEQLIALEPTKKNKKKKNGLTGFILGQAIKKLGSQVKAVRISNIVNFVLSKVINKARGEGEETDGSIGSPDESKEGGEKPEEPLKEEEIIDETIGKEEKIVESIEGVQSLNGEEGIKGVAEEEKADESTEEEGGKVEEIGETEKKVEENIEKEESTEEGGRVEEGTEKEENSEESTESPDRSGDSTENLQSADKGDKGDRSDN